MTTLNLNQDNILSDTNLMFIKQKTRQCLKDDHIKASQTFTLNVSLPRAVLVSFNVFLITVIAHKRSTELIKQAFEQDEKIA